MTAAEQPRRVRPRVPRQAWIDIAVLSLLSLLGLLGFESSFGGLGFLIAACGGLVVGIAVGVLAFQLGFGIPLTAVGGVVAYFLLGTALAVPSQGIANVVPTLTSLSSLAIGSVNGWKDLLTLTTPVGAPVYIAAVPYVAAWAVGLVFTSIATRWLPQHPRSAWRYSIALVGPVALYVIGILVGTDEPVLAVARGISFAIITLVWLGWRRTPNQSASARANRALLRRKFVGTVVVVAIAAVVAGGVSAIVPPNSYARFVLRDKITPPFDPLQYASPLSAFRYYTKSAANAKLFTVTGLKKGDLIRLATMDSYTGQLWNVVGTDANADGSGAFDLVGSQLPSGQTQNPATPRNVTLTVDGYNGVWVPLVGSPSTLSVSGTASGDEVHYNAVTKTAVVTSAQGGATRGAKFAFTSTVPKTPSAAALSKLSTAQVNLPTVYSVDAIATQAEKHGGSATASAYSQLKSLEKYLLTGYLSHGTAQSPSVSGHGANRMTAMFPPNGTLVGDAEQYASAFALEARALRLPARVVMGFKPKVSTGQKSVTVVGSEVTAWDEVDFEGVGWVSFFPTPARTGTPPKTPPPPVSQSITQSRQPNRIGQPANNVLSPVAIKKQKQNPSLFTLPAWVYVTAAIVAIPVVLYFIPLLIVGLVKRRRRRRRRESGSGDLRVAGAWDELLDNYGELGFRVPRRSTRIATARLVQKQAPIDGDSDLPTLVELAAGTDAAVFSGVDVADAEVSAAWQRAQDELRRARRAVPGWRRWLSGFRIRSKRGLPDAITSIDTASVAGRVKELVNR